MIRYIPFLKAKSNEVNAVGELEAAVSAAICPFFDYPRKNGLTGATFKAGVERIERSFNKHIGTEREFYIDCFDIEDGLRVGRKHNYQFLLECFGKYRAIPVVSIDRSQSYIAAVRALKEDDSIRSGAIAVRFTQEDFEDYGVVRGDIADKLAATLELFDSTDLIIDCRYCASLDPNVLAPMITMFSKGFCADYAVRRIVVTGSSIPASAGDILEVKQERVIERREIEIFKETKKRHGHWPIIFGDYTTVSPLYSDVSIAPEILQNVMTAKLTYTHGTSHYFIRGAALKTNGRQQYFGMAKTLCRKSFFRGANFSKGEGYFDQKSKGIGSNCQPNTVIKPAVVSHITYMVLGGVI